MVEPEGVFNGREAIEKALTDLFQRWRPTNFLSEANKLNSIGNGAWAVGQWWCTLEGQSGPVPMMGYWSEVYVRGLADPRVDPRQQDSVASAEC